MNNKFKSRKFIVSVAAFLGSISTSIAGLAIDNEIVTAIGLVCGVLSTAIYCGCEAYIDAKAVKVQVVEVTTSKE